MKHQNLKNRKTKTHKLCLNSIFHQTKHNMNHCVSIFFFFITCIVADVSISTTQSQQLSLLHNGFSPSLPPSSSPLVSNSLDRKPVTALVAGLDGTIYLVESASGRVIWSFSSGSPIYHSSANTPPSSGLIECGDDWELIFHDPHFGKTVLSF